MLERTSVGNNNISRIFYGNAELLKLYEGTVIIFDLTINAVQNWRISTSQQSYTYYETVQTGTTEQTNSGSASGTASTQSAAQSAANAAPSAPSGWNLRNVSASVTVVPGTPSVPSVPARTVYDWSVSWRYSYTSGGNVESRSRSTSGTNTQSTLNSAIASAIAGISPSSGWDSVSGISSSTGSPRNITLRAGYGSGAERFTTSTAISSGLRASAESDRSSAIAAGATNVSISYRQGVQVVSGGDGTITYENSYSVSGDSTRTYFDWTVSWTESRGTPGQTIYSGTSSSSGTASSQSAANSAISSAVGSPSYPYTSTDQISSSVTPRAIPGTAGTPGTANYYRWSASWTEYRSVPVYGQVQRTGYNTIYIAQWDALPDGTVFTQYRIEREGSSDVIISSITTTSYNFGTTNYRARLRAENPGQGIESPWTAYIQN